MINSGGAGRTKMGPESLAAGRLESLSSTIHSTLELRFHETHYRDHQAV